MTKTFREHLQRAIPETCDLCNIWSEWWRDMTRPKRETITMTNTETKTMSKTKIFREYLQRAIPETCEIWDTDYNFDNWEPGFMTICVTWQLRVTLDSIRNSCDVFSQKNGILEHPRLNIQWKDLSTVPTVADKRVRNLPLIANSSWCKRHWQTLTVQHFLNFAYSSQYSNWASLINIITLLHIVYNRKLVSVVKFLEKLCLNFQWPKSWNSLDYRDVRVRV